MKAAVVESRVNCPYCGESITLVVDCSIEEQDYIEDCFVCCRPINITVLTVDDAEPILTVAAENE